MKKEPFNRILDVQDFSFSYENPEDPLLKNIHFSLYENETVLLIGASGSGKSSLALCLNGLYPEAVEGVSSGDIYYRGKHVQEFPKGELNQQIGIVFQDPDSQFCMIKVEDELAFTLENRKVPSMEMPQHISQALQDVGMEGFEKKKIHELSGGQKQKIALASVLLLEPELLILDEPTANLDPLSRVEFIDLLHSLQQKKGLTLLIIEHEPDDWLDMTDRVLAVGSSGKLIAEGPAHTVFTRQAALLKKEGMFLPKCYMSDNKNFRVRPALPTSEEILSVKNLTFKRKRDTVLQNVNLEINRGEFVSIAGENGAGKSTLLQQMAGLLSCKKGRILFFDKELQQWNQKDLRKRIGYVFQNPEHQFITDTVIDELTYGMKLNGYAEEKQEEAATRLMEQFHLMQHRFSNPFSLSGGQKRRLSVATMLDQTPDILFFDEPTFGQDASTTEELMHIVRQLQAEYGVTIVFVTHDMDIVDSTDRAIILHDRNIIFDGEPEDLWNREDVVNQARLRLPYRIRNIQQEGVIHDLIH
ncbi:ABC transporter ATP-binding protein [Virgibacillus kimchii]